MNAQATSQAKDLALQATDLAVSSARSFAETTPNHSRRETQNIATTPTTIVETPEQRFKACSGFVTDPVT